MPPKRRAKPVAIPVQALAPIIKPIIEPVVETVVQQLSRHEKLLEDMKAALDVQFKRTAAIQAQLDHLVATLSKRRA